jgi:metal-responsive CopG/Arc/MetJ family transcriptional regulator
MQHIRTFQMRVDDEFLRQLDDWRRLQPEIPSRAEAIRRLVQEAMERTREESRPAT